MKLARGGQPRPQKGLMQTLIIRLFKGLIKTLALICSSTRPYVTRLSDMAVSHRLLSTNVTPIKTSQTNSKLSQNQRKTAKTT